MPVFSDVNKLLEEVSSDVEAALGPAFPGTFSVAAPFAPLLPIENDTVTVVPWVWQGRHDGQFFEARATGLPVEVSGITMVRIDDRELFFHRIVDWHTLYRQIGFLMVCRRPRSPDTENADRIDIPGVAS